MKKLLFFLLVSYIFCGCKQTIYDRVNTEMKSCNQDTCTIYFTDIFKFKWDTVYILDAAQGIPIKYNKYRIPDFDLDVDISRKIVFTKNSKIVYEEPADLVSEPHPVSFCNNIIEYTPQNAVFYVTPYNYHDKKYYTLTPKKENRPETK